MIASTALAQLPCGVIVVDSKNAILQVNSVLCDWLGYDRTQLQDTGINSLFTPATRLMYLGHMLPTLQTHGYVEEKFIMLKHASGSELPVMFNARQVQQGQEPPHYIFVVMRMLRRQLIEEQLLAERRRAEQATSEKDNLNKQLETAQKELLAKHQELMQLNSSLEAQSVTDALTGLFNRRFYDGRIDTLLAQYERHGTPFALILIDIDFLKKLMTYMVMRWATLCCKR